MSKELIANEDNSELLVFLGEIHDAFADEISNLPETDNIEIVAQLYWKYLYSVEAAAEEFGVDLFDGDEIPTNRDDLINKFWVYKRNVEKNIVKSQVKYRIHRMSNGVTLTEAERTKIRHFVDQIKSVLDSSGLTVEKKEAIHTILTRLLEEIEKDRTRLGAFAEAVSAIARISKEFANEGVKPWFNLLQPIFEILGAAKNRDERPEQLPAPERRKRIEGPK